MGKPSFSFGVMIGGFFAMLLAGDNPLMTILGFVAVAIGGARCLGWRR